jgi:hypothetical protein
LGILTNRKTTENLVFGGFTSKWQRGDTTPVRSTHSQKKKKKKKKIEKNEKVPKTKRMETVLKRHTLEMF